jgi:4a-hydroxytetrahydrobiopterin dehydratase
MPDIIDLRTKKCVPCEGGVAPFSETQSKEMLAQVGKTWNLVGNKINADFKFKDFKEAMVFINNVADLAEAEGHHPDIYVSYNKVRLELWTHAIGGLSENDFILASKIDGIIEKTESGESLK